MMQYILDRVNQGEVISQSSPNLYLMVITKEANKNDALAFLENKQAWWGGLGEPGVTLGSFCWLQKARADVRMPPRP